MKKTLCCLDCGKSYADEDWLDVVMTDEQWLKIHPEGYGDVLCGACMIERIRKLPKVTHVHLVIDEEELG